jgi:hypothetical protein
MKWINCTDRLPETMDRVLIVTKRKVVKIGELMEMIDGWVTDNDEYIDLNYITHWMILPEKPNRED